MRTAQELQKIAKAASGEDEGVIPLAIYGLCETAAESGDYLCAFSRKEYTIEQFDHMVKLGCVVEWDCSTIYVRWA